jgi:predicted Zn-dependent peptidase
MTPQILRVGAHATLLAVQTDRFKSELLNVQFAVPTKEKTAQRYALLFELLRRGTERYPTKAQFYRHLDDLYASDIRPYCRRAGDMQLLGASAEFLGARFVGGGMGLLPELCEMLAEFLLHPYLPNGTFHAPYLESEKRHLRDGIRARINNPRGYARGKCRKMLFAGEPYALSLAGEEETVDAITAEALSALWQELTASLTPTFFYIGNTSPEVVASLLERTLPFAGMQTNPAQTLVKMPADTVLRAEEEMPLCQGKLSIGYRTDITMGHRLAPAMSMLNEIFGGSAASKLFLNVREKRSLCYHCSSALDLYKGAIFVGSGIRVENREVTEEAIRTEFEALLRGDITQTEWDAAKRSRDFACRQLSDHPSSLCDFYMGRHLLGLTETPEERRAAFAAVTREDVAEAAAHLREGAVFFLKGTLKGEEDDENE